ncbi:unnamed protein product [Eruca vesicaria subsp. sativa]|uniref:Uncharacterized protein n=1 Tax=Eruca vesicaria subsp. sativa TaxID=29727 RepID=A0ABC8LSQ4_ERUVS|nr:unnamed protein product [Eruca vesicaria subsp. sativa]
MDLDSLVWSSCILSTINGLGLVYGGDPFDSGLVYSSSQFSSSSVPLLLKLNGIVLTVLGPAFGYPIASSAVGVLKGLWRNDLPGLKGDCPNCGEEVFAFARGRINQTEVCVRVGWKMGIRQDIPCFTAKKRSAFQVYIVTSDQKKNISFGDASQFCYEGY